jgi:hypothetical protein
MLLGALSYGENGYGKFDWRPSGTGVRDPLRVYWFRPDSSTTRTVLSGSASHARDPETAGKNGVRGSLAGYGEARRSSVLARSRHRSSVGCGIQTGRFRCALSAGDSRNGYVRDLHPGRSGSRVVPTKISWLTKHSSRLLRAAAEFHGLPAAWGRRVPSTVGSCDPHWSRHDGPFGHRH